MQYCRVLVMVTSGITGQLVGNVYNSTNYVKCPCNNFNKHHFDQYFINNNNNNNNNNKLWF